MLEDPRAVAHVAGRDRAVEVVVEVPADPAGLPVHPVEMERVGEPWWPVLGAVYFLVAVRRVRGMHLVGKVRKERVKATPSPAVASVNRRR